MLYVPSFPFQLLLDNKLTYTFNCDVIFTHHKVIFQDPLTKKMIGEGFFFFCIVSIISLMILKFLEDFRLVSNHPMSHSYGIVLQHIHQIFFSKINLVPTKEPFKCEICHFPKLSKLPSNPFISRDTHAFGLVHSYVWRPFYTSLDGFKYSVTFIDDFSRVTQVYC